MQSQSRLATLLRKSILAALLIPLLLAGGCSMTQPYKRTLPAWILRVYVPIADNQSAEPGLEERISNAFTEEILADGRVEIARKRNCNAIAKVSILDYKEASSYFAEDDVETQREIILTLELKLYEPSDTELENPIGVAEKFDVELNYSSDYRSTRSTLNIDARENLIDKAARRLVQALMSRTKMTEEM